jgi:hypothetical protein
MTSIKEKVEDALEFAIGVALAAAMATMTEKTGDHLGGCRLKR